MAQRKQFKRKPVSPDIAVMVLTEAGYRCAVPTCRGILAIDLHHMVEVAIGGGNTVENLLPLCPTCHALYHRKIIGQQSIYIWKSILVSLTRAFDQFVIDQLLFLSKERTTDLRVSGDGILSFARLIAAGLAQFKLEMQNGPLLLYSISLSDTGKQLVTAWLSGNRNAVRNALC